MIPVVIQLYSYTPLPYFSKIHFNAIVLLLCCVCGTQHIFPGLLPTKVARDFSISPRHMPRHLILDHQALN
jgi:hypothetical protein